MSEIPPENARRVSYAGLPSRGREGIDGTVLYPSRGSSWAAHPDVAASIREARRAVRDLGFKAVFLRPNPPRGG